MIKTLQRKGQTSVTITVMYRLTPLPWLDLHGQGSSSLGLDCPPYSDCALYQYVIASWSRLPGVGSLISLIVTIKHFIVSTHMVPCIPWWTYLVYGLLTLSADAPGVKNQPSCVSKQLRFDKDVGMWEFIKHGWQYDLQKKDEASAIIGIAVVSSTTPSNVQEDTCMLPQQTAKSWWLGSVSHD